jgi:hypothetical protein
MEASNRDSAGGGVFGGDSILHETSARENNGLEPLPAIWQTTIDPLLN